MASMIWDFHENVEFPAKFYIPENRFMQTSLSSNYTLKSTLHISSVKFYPKKLDTLSYH